VPQYFRAFLAAQPIADTKAKLFDPFHRADTRGQFGTQQTRIGGLMRQPPNSCQLLKRLNSLGAFPHKCIVGAFPPIFKLGGFPPKQALFPRRHGPLRIFQNASATDALERAPVALFFRSTGTNLTSLA
jgi:hypothetical protein